MSTIDWRKIRRGSIPIYLFSRRQCPTAWTNIFVSGISIADNVRYVFAFDSACASSDIVIPNSIAGYSRITSTMDTAIYISSSIANLGSGVPTPSACTITLSNAVGDEVVGGEFAASSRYSSTSPPPANRSGQSL